MIVQSGWTNASGSIVGLDVTEGVERHVACRSMPDRRHRLRVVTRRSSEHARQRGRRAGLHDRRGRDRARPRRRAERRPRPRSSVLRRPAVAELVRGHHTLRIYNLLAYGDAVRSAFRCTSTCCPIVEGVLDPGCLISSLSSIAILPGRDRATDPRRRPAHPAAEAAPADRVQLDVGAHRLHRGERRDAARARLAPAATTPPTTARLRLDRGRDAEGLGARLARQPVARRRRQPHRRAPHRHRHELLRRATSASRRTSSSDLDRDDGRTSSSRACASSSATASTTGSSATSTSTAPRSCSSVTHDGKMVWDEI